MIYFTSDLHFYHEKIIQHTSRPFHHAEEMNKKLIDKWNRKVMPTDEIYILGDVTMKGASYASQALNALHGKKYLIRGNHDHFVDQPNFDQNLFLWIKDYHELTYQNETFILFHYPIEEWNGFFRGTIHLHGHQHNHSYYNYDNLKKRIKRFDVGVDANEMEPVSIEDILAFFSLMPPA